MDFTAIFTLCLVLVTLAQLRATDRISKDAIKSQRENTRLNLTMQLIEKYDSESIRAKRRELARSLIQRRMSASPSNVGVYISGVEYVLDILETTGALHQRDLLDKPLAYNSFSYPVVQWWYALEDYISDARKEGITEYYDRFQYLAESFIRIEKANGQLNEAAKQKELDAFLQSEVV